MKRVDDALRLLRDNDELRRQPVEMALRCSGRLCVACGGTRAPGDSRGACSDCGAVEAILPGFVDPRGSLLGRIYRQGRIPFRRKLAICVGLTASGATLLLSDGTQESVPLEQLPKEAPENDLVELESLASPAARLLWWAQHGTQVKLPWSAAQLAGQLAVLARTDLPQARLLALDALTLRRPDLLDGFGLTDSEVHWLRLVDAARRRDGEGVVANAAALPLDRYAAKIAILAAFTEELPQVPHVAQRLGPCLATYAATEPLAEGLQRKLGLRPSTPGSALADLRLRAERFAVPRSIADLLWHKAGEQARLLLGPRGRFALTHARTDRQLTVLDGPALRAARLAAIDDLVDAGLLGAELIRASGRPASDQSYLLGRVAPERLTDDQLVALRHADEIARRAFLAGDDEVVKASPDSPVRRHLGNLLAWKRNRPQDVASDAMLPGYQDVMAQLVDVLTATGAATALPLTDAVVADRSTWRPLAVAVGADRLLKAEKLAERHPRFFEWLSLYAAREHLFQADWDGGVAAARHCLDLAMDEGIRDEAQNLLACGLLYLGDHLGALRELQSAIEGEYSVALLANIGVVAGQLDGELAARHLARIVQEAPTVAMRANAAVRALAIWQGETAKIWQGAESDEELPVVLREPLRSIVLAPISLDQFRLITDVLATRDAAWVRNPANLGKSPHAGTLEAKYATARAWVGGDKGFEPLLEMFERVSDWASVPDWLREGRDDLVDQTTTFLIDHIDDPDNAGAFAFQLATRAGLDTRARIELSLLSTAGIAFGLTSKGKEVSDAVVAVYRKAIADLEQLDAEAAEPLELLVEGAGRRIAINQHQAWVREINACVGTYNAAIDLLNRSERGSSAWFAGRRAIAVMAETCQRAREQLLPWSRVLEHANARGDLLDFLDEVRELEFKAHRVLGD